MKSSIKTQLRIFQFELLTIKRRFVAASPGFRALSISTFLMLYCALQTLAASVKWLSGPLHYSEFASSQLMRVVVISMCAYTAFGVVRNNASNFSKYELSDISPSYVHVDLARVLALWFSGMAFPLFLFSPIYNATDLITALQFYGLVGAGVAWSMMLWMIWQRLCVQAFGRLGNALFLYTPMLMYVATAASSLVLVHYRHELTSPSRTDQLITLFVTTLIASAPFPLLASSRLFRRSIQDQPAIVARTDKNRAEAPRRFRSAAFVMLRSPWVSLLRNTSDMTELGKTLGGGVAIICILSWCARNTSKYESLLVLLPTVLMALSASQISWRYRFNTSSPQIDDISPAPPSTLFLWRMVSLALPLCVLDAALRGLAWAILHTSGFSYGTGADAALVSIIISTNLLVPINKRTSQKPTLLASFELVTFVMAATLLML